jgi:2-C-methyl-D-erythritol 2,4-cyclodiphosphate synthase
MIRSGIGYDAHQFGDNRRLVIGGVAIPHDRGLIGHSDADVLLHATADALLGAAALGDIGQHFPSSDPTYRDADSLALLATANLLVVEAGFSAVNIDATVIAEAPLLFPFVAEMRSKIASVLDLQPEAVNVKATTNEGMGFVGRNEGIAAIAIATIVVRSEG